MRTRITVHLNKIKRNLEIVREHLPKSTQIIGIVKANAYGHGDVPVSRYLEDKCGITMFAVAGLDEALRLREGGVRGDILVLSYVDPSDTRLAVENNITLSLISPEHAIAVSRAACESGLTARVHVKLNTGMNRVGFECKSFKQVVAIAGCYRLPNLEFKGIFSHFSSSDDSSSGAEPYTKLQLERFSKVLSFLSERGINPGLRHISNSGAIGKYPDFSFDAVRCGALMYGYNTAEDAKLPVEPVMEWKASVSMTRQLEFGDAVSYSRRFVARERVNSATLCIGYADGLPRCLTNKGTVILNGQKCPSIGSICMDQMVVDITGIKGEVRMGDEAVIIGPGQSADDLALQAGTCMHHILASISARVERVFVEE